MGIMTEEKRLFQIEKLKVIRSMSDTSAHECLIVAKWNVSSALKIYETTDLEAISEAAHRIEVRRLLVEFGHAPDFYTV